MVVAPIVCEVLATQPMPLEVIDQVVDVTAGVAGGGVLANALERAVEKGGAAAMSSRSHIQPCWPWSNSVSLGFDWLSRAGRPAL